MCVGCCGAWYLSRDVSGRPLPKRIAWYRRCTVCAARLQPGVGFTALQEAVNRNDEEAVSLLLWSGTEDLNATAHGCPALHIAIQNANARIVEMLLRAGADARYADCFSGPLASACVYSFSHPDISLAVIRLLIAHGADVNQATESGQTALMVAKDPRVASVLIEHGAELDAADRRTGMTALHMALAARRRRVALLLIQAGADINALDREGRSPMDIALRIGDAETASLLAAKGAVPGSGGAASPAWPSAPR